MSAPIALITGGTSGIGKVTAKLLAAKGAAIYICGLRATEGAQVVKEILAAGGSCRFVSCDVRDEASIKTMIEGIVAEHGRLDWAANCAAVSLETKPLADSASDLFKTMSDINLTGLYHSMKYEIRQMQRSPLFASYAATKFGVVGLTKSAALEYAAQNIRINAVAPGAVRTELLEKLFAMGQFDEAALAATHPMKRIGEPQEIARGIAWLLSDEASFVTGNVLSIDGGLNAQ
jgi:NAD(P)-dependent dehydrogenase (short-subunit alcohol dehydrogenase family)